MKLDVPWNSLLRLVSTFGRWLADLGSSPKGVTARLLPVVNRRLTLAVVVLVALTGLLPVGVIVATGIVVGSVPSALGEGLGSGPGRHCLLALGLLGGLFIALQIASSARAAVAGALGLALNRHLEERVMVAVGSPAAIGHLEDPEMLDLIRAARDVVFGGYRPCDAVPAMAARTNAWLQGTGAAVVLATYRWWLAAPLYGAWVWRGRVLKRQHLRSGKVVGEKSVALRRAEYLRDLALTPGAAKEVRVFGLSEWLIGRFRAETSTVLNTASKERAAGKGTRRAATVACVALSLVAYLVLGVSAARGHLDLHGLALYAAAVAGIGVVVHVGIDNVMLERGSIPVVAVGALEAAIATTATPGTVPPGDAPSQSVRFADVTFRYPGSDHDALSHLDLILPAVRSVAIVGANGAGTTTLVKLLCRFYEPDHGQIIVDGVDVTSYQAGAWQRRVAAVFQDFCRYPVSAADNITFGAVEHRDDTERLEDAARRSGALETIEALPRGFGTGPGPRPRRRDRPLRRPVAAGGVGPGAVRGQRRRPHPGSRRARRQPRRPRRSRSLRPVPRHHLGRDHGHHLAPLFHRATSRRHLRPRGWSDGRAR